MLKGLFRILPVFFVLSGCTTVTFTAPLEGTYINAIRTVKNFTVVGSIIVKTQEIHKAGPFGIKKSVDGAKVGYSDLMREAAALGADDIIDVRIDMNTNGKTGFFGWLTGWEKVFNYTGEAIAIQYIDKSITAKPAEEAITDDHGTAEEQETAAENENPVIE